MRNISSSLLEQQFGLEPLIVVGVKWQGSRETRYGDETTLDYPGRILEISGIDDVVKLSGGGSTAGVTVKLDDSDGSLYELMKTNDIHKKPVTIYQAFGGTPDLFPIYHGEINTPIVWSEADRTLTFDVLTIIEDREVGFAPEEGQFPNLPEEAVGVAWPMAFGSPRKVPGVTYQYAPVGQITSNILVPDRTLPVVRTYLNAKLETFNDDISLILFYQAAATAAGDFEAADAFRQQAVAVQEQANQIRRNNLEKIHDLQQREAEYHRQIQNLVNQLTGPITENSTRLANGARGFPQGKEIYCRCGDYILKGVVSGDTFNFSVVRPPAPRMISWAQGEEKGVAFIVPAYGVSDMYVDFQNQIRPYFTGSPGRGPHGEVIPVGFRYADSIDPEGVGVIPAGTPIEIISDVSQEFIISITPCEVERVWAWKKVGNTRQLCPVPPTYYEVTSRNYGTVNARIVRLKRHLSGYAYEGWEDQIFVDLIGEIGPDVGDVMRYLIEQYTTREIDEDYWEPGTSDASPCNFAMTERGNILSVLADMAYQSRNIIWLRNGKFACKYLSTEESAVMALTKDDVIANTLSIEATSTEELVTKVKATYRHDYSIDRATTVIAKANDDRYGLKEETINYYIYTQAEAVAKSTTFWLIRKSNTWKRIKCKATLKFLALETFDTISVDLEWVSNGGVKGIVESCVYDSTNRDVDLTVWVPVLFGSMKPHPLAWSGSAEKVIHPYVPENFQQPEKPPFYEGDIGGDLPLVLGGGIKYVYNWPERTTQHQESVNKVADLLPTDTEDVPPWVPPPPTEPTLPTTSDLPPYDYGGIFEDLEIGAIATASAAGGSIPGKVLSGEGDTYQVALYPKGPDGPSQDVEVRQLMIAEGEIIPEDTWVMVSKLKNEADETEYFMQVPVWLE